MLCFSSRGDDGDNQEIIYSDCEDIGANTELIFDENIPAEFEEEVVTIAEDDSFDEFHIDDDSFPEPEGIVSLPVLSPQPHPRSILLPQSEVKFKQTLTVNRSLLKTSQRQLETMPSNSSTPTPAPSTSTTKFRQTLNVKPTNFLLNEHTMRIFKNKIKAMTKRKAQAVAREKKQRPKKLKPAKVHRPKKVSSKKPKPVNYIPQKPKPVVDPKNSGEIVRVEIADSDIEVDILSNSEEDLILIEPPNYDELNEFSGSTEEVSVDDPDGSWANEMHVVCDDTEDDETSKRLQELSETDLETWLAMESLEVPETELSLDPNSVSNLERFMHSEFFLQRPTKTPERYLKIRNHILAMWTNCKPSYLQKTSARHGLKKCGDVNCISRVHSMLEQIGAINFNCQEVAWVRPLRILYKAFQQNIRNKSQSSRSNLIVDKKQRIRNSTNIFGAHDANFTIAHDDSIYNSNSSDSMVHRIKSRTIHRTQFELIKCQQFSKENPAPFQVTINLSCLLCLYFHALSSKLEIMGFLGGKCDSDGKLNLTRYRPCRTSNQTAINCEMCPVSQVEQSCNLIEEGHTILGWFHSHPSFPPIPSRTDLKTQAELQLQFASNNPFIGFIISCVDMEFK